MNSMNCSSKTLCVPVRERMLLTRILLVWVLLLQAPLMGAMTVHLTADQALASQNGQNNVAGTERIVICAVSGIKTISLSGAVPPDSPGKTDCYCPCATGCVADSLSEPVFHAHSVVYPEQCAAGLARGSLHVPSQSLIDRGTGSPRSPPLRSIVSIH